MSEQKCCDRVWNQDGSWGNKWKPCSCKAKYEHEGKPYCGKHYPPNVKARRDASYAKAKAGWDADAEKVKRQAICVKVCEGISNESLEAGLIAKLIEACKTLRESSGDAMERLNEANDILQQTRGEPC